MCMCVLGHIFVRIFQGMFIRKIFSHFVCLNYAFQGGVAPFLIICICLFSSELQKNSTTDRVKYLICNNGEKIRN